MQARNPPLVWRHLTHDKRRFALSLSGITFASVLMFMQLGFLNAVLDSQVKLLAGIKADLVITSRLKSRLGFQEPFARRRLEEARGVPGVAAVSPLYIALADWKNPETRNSRRIRVIGIPPEDWAILNLNLEPLAFVLREYDAALIDLRSKNVYGPRRAGVVTELAGRRIRVMGTFTLGTDFDNDGTVIIGEMNFLKLFPEQRTSDPQLSRVELGLVQLSPGASAPMVREALRSTLPGDIHIWTRSELIDQEIHYWRALTPIGSIFVGGLAVGFVVGVVICSQILFTSVIDRMAVFGMLKAIGYTDRYVMSLVVREALLASTIGFLPAIAVSLILYSFLASITGFEMHLTAGRLLLVMGLTVGMSTVAAVIAVRKAVTADPAEVFK